jgi:hypothetical protein
MTQKIEPLNASEKGWLEENPRRLRTFAGKPADHRFSLPEIDALYRDWRTGDHKDEDPNPMINAFGTAFGQHFVDQLSMSWSVVTDEHGTEMAVTAQPGDIVVFPPNFVGKRYASGEVGFFEPGFDAMAKDIARVREELTKKSWWKVW